MSKRYFVRPNSGIRRFLIVALILYLIGIGLVACEVVPDGGATPAPTMTVAPAPKSYAHRGKITALFCADTTGSYKRAYFDAGKQLIIKSFASAGQPNQDGVTLYVATINYDPVEPENSLDPLTIPAIANYPARVTVIPYPATFENRFTAQKTMRTIDDANTKAISAYNVGVAQINETVKKVVASVNANAIKRFQAWNPPEDDRGTSVLGCLYLVKNRLQTTSDIKELFIASDLEDNVTTSLTNDFVQTQGLKNVSVHVIYLPGTAVDNVKRANWCAFFHHAGASVVRFDDTATSANLSDLLNADLHLSPTC